MKSTKQYFNSDNKFNKIIKARLGRKKAQGGIPDPNSMESLQNVLNNVGPGGIESGRYTVDEMQAQNNAANRVANEENQMQLIPTPPPPSAIENPALAAFRASQANLMRAARAQTNLIEQQKLAEGSNDPAEAIIEGVTELGLPQGAGQGGNQQMPTTLNNTNPAQFGESVGTSSANTMDWNNNVPDFVTQGRQASEAANVTSGMTTNSAGSAGAGKASGILAGLNLFGKVLGTGFNDQDPTTYNAGEIAGDVLQLKFGEIYRKAKNRKEALAEREKARAREVAAGQQAAQAYDQAVSVTAPFTGQTYGQDTGAINRYISQSGGAADVSNLGKMPKGTTVELPGGEAVSLGEDKVEYRGNSHEKGGILTGGKETFEVEGGEVEGPVKTAEGGTMRYIFSDYPKFAVNGETPADMVRNGKPIQEAVKINEIMASKIPTDFGGPADPSRSPDKFAQAGTWKTEDDTFKYRTQRPGYLDMGGNINASSWRNIQNTDWGQYYGVTPETTQSQLKEIYNNQYMQDVNRFYSPENKAQAVETLKLFAEQETPAGDNFRRAFRGLDFDNPQHHDRILQTAKRKSTDGKIGAFHFIPALGAAESEQAETTGTSTETEEKTASETTTNVAEKELDLTDPEQKERIPGLGYKKENAVPGLAFLGMGAGLLPAFAPKIPPAELIKGTPGIRAPRLPRENLKGMEAAVASDFAATIESLERAGNSSSGIYNNLLLKKLSADSQIAAQELSANKQLAGTEAGLRLKAAAANMAAYMERQAKNAAAINDREEFKQEQVRADLDNISDNLQESAVAAISYNVEKQLADAIDVYDTRGYDRTLKMYKKERDKADRKNDTDSPFYGKTDDELRQAAQSEIQSRTGYDPTDKTMSLEDIMRRLEMLTKTDQGEPEPKRTGGKKYFSKINKIKR